MGKFVETRAIFMATVRNSWRVSNPQSVCTMVISFRSIHRNSWTPPFVWIFSNIWAAANLRTTAFSFLQSLEKDIASDSHFQNLSIRMVFCTTLEQRFAVFPCLKVAPLGFQCCILDPATVQHLFTSNILILGKSLRDVFRPRNLQYQLQYSIVPFISMPNFKFAKYRWRLTSFTEVRQLPFMFILATQCAQCFNEPDFLVFFLRVFLLFFKVFSLFFLVSVSLWLYALQQCWNFLSTRWQCTCKARYPKTPGLKQEWESLGRISCHFPHSQKTSLCAK